MKPIHELLVRDYMSRGPLTLTNDTDRITSAIRLMADQQRQVLPVVDAQGVVIGILSMTDMIELTREIQSDLNSLVYVSEATQEFLIKQLIEQGDTTRVADVMTAPVETVRPETPLIVAAQEMLKHHYHHIPVVDEKGEAVAVLSTTDLVRALVELGVGQPRGSTVSG